MPSQYAFLRTSTKCQDESHDADGWPVLSRRKQYKTSTYGGAGQFHAEIQHFNFIRLIADLNPENA